MDGSDETLIESRNQVKILLEETFPPSEDA